MSFKSSDSVWEITFGVSSIGFWVLGGNWVWLKMGLGNEMDFNQTGLR